MRIRIELTGTAPLLMHNERLSDPDDEFARQIKEITDKGTNQTTADKELVSKLEWFGGLYTYTNGVKEVVLPTANVIRCLRETAAITKDGKRIARGISPLVLHVPLLHGGPKDVAKLYEDGKYIDRRQVKVGRGRIKRTRPIFPQWAAAFDFELLTDVLNLQRLIDIAELAGLATGLGDARILGYGRFKAAVKKV